MSLLWHYGVKGMKWGVRRDQAVLDRLAGRRTRSSAATRSERKADNKAAKQQWKDFKSTTSRKERRGMRREALESRAGYVIDRAMNEDNAYVSLMNSATGQKTIATGHQFIAHLAAGGAFDVKTTEIVTIEQRKG